jgi:hypothetical protein
VVRASEVVLLWAHPGELAKLKQQHPSRSSAVRIAAVRPGQVLAFQDLEELEDAGVLVVQVPSSVPSESNAEVAKYLTGQLRAGTKATQDRMVALGTCEPATAAAGQRDLTQTKKAEAQLLELINDPVNQLGTPM